MKSADFTIPSLFTATLNASPGATFLQYRQGQQILSLTYGEIALAVNRLAMSLIQSGYQKGDRIALLAENSCEWVITYLAILQAGCVVVPLDSIMPLPDILHILDLSRSRLLFCSDRFADQVADLPQLQQVPVVRLGRYQTQRDSVTPYEVQSQVLPSDAAVIIYTSGTTGHSKGVVLTHDNLVVNVLACREVCKITRNDNFLLLLPLHHAFSSTVNMLLSLASGARATLATSYRSKDIIDDIQISGVTVLVGVPRIFENIMNSILRAVASSGSAKRAFFHALKEISHFSKYSGLKLGYLLFRSLRNKAGLQSVRLMVSGGAALPVAVNRFFENMGFILIQGYGLTESSPVLCVNPPAKNRLGSVGPALPGVTLRIHDPNEEGIGEVWARGLNIMKGYYQNEKASRDVLRDGWLMTGDAGYLDKDGYLYLTGRLKNVIVTSAGKNIYPEEIESRLGASQAISEALILGVKRTGRMGESLGALLKLDEEYLKSQSIDRSPEKIAAEIIHNYNQSSPSHQNIREWQLIDGEFEKTSTGKIKRFLYKDRFQ